MFPGQSGWWLGGLSLPLYGAAVASFLAPATAAFTKMTPKKLNSKVQKTLKNHLKSLSLSLHILYRNYIKFCRKKVSKHN